MTKATIYRQEMLARAAAEGLSPLEIMMTAMRDAWKAGKVDEAVRHAAAAAPYVHPRLNATKHSGEISHPPAYMTGIPGADADDDDQRPNVSSH